MMTSNGQSSTKKILLLMAGLGALGAIVLIGLGLVLFFAQTSTPPTAAETTPTATRTATLPPPTPTIVAGVVIMASPTPEPTTAAPLEETADTLNKPPTATRMPTTTSTPTTIPQRRPAVVTVDGAIELVSPQDDIHIPTDEIEFQWKWHDNKGCNQPPDGFAFEIRIWRDNDFAGPMGAMDAQVQKPNITCDPATGVRAFTLGRVRSVPGAEGQSSGRLRWDVALVQVSPYKPVITTGYRTFFY